MEESNLGIYRAHFYHKADDQHFEVSGPTRTSIEKTIARVTGISVDDLGVRDEHLIPVVANIGFTPRGRFVCSAALDARQRRWLGFYSGDRSFEVIDA